MNTNILKTVISSIGYTASVDVSQIDAFDPTSANARSVGYLKSLANIARNVSKAYKCIEVLIVRHISEVAANNAVADLIVGDETFPEYDRQIADEVNAKIASAIAADISEQHRKEGTVCSEE